MGVIRRGLEAGRRVSGGNTRRVSPGRDAEILGGEFWLTRASSPHATHPDTTAGARTVPARSRSDAINHRNFPGRLSRSRTCCGPGRPALRLLSRRPYVSFSGGLNAICLLLALTFGLMSAVSQGAGPTQPAAAAQTSASNSGTVGGLGKREALIFEGNRVFSAETIRSALGGRIDFLLAAHPAAPLGDYPPMIERMVRTAYLRQGFPDVKVKAGVSTDGQQVRVTIDEGPRYKVGKIRFAGVQAIADPGLQQRLRDALTQGGRSVRGAAADAAIDALWKPGEYAMFDESAAAGITARVEGELTELNFYKPELKVSVVPVPATREGELVIEMVNEGFKGTIEDIGFFYPSDEKKNADAEVESFLGLKVGMPLRANLPLEITNRLWQSGRFLKHKASLVPLPGDGHFKLELDLEDLPEAPPLKQALSTNETIVLKLCEWLNAFPRHPEDLAFSVRGTHSGEPPINVELVFSRSGLAWVVRNESSNRAPVLAYGMAVSSNWIQYVAGWRQRKLITPAAGNFAAFVSLLAKGESDSDNRYNFMIGAGLGTGDADEPIKMRVTVAPVPFLDSARKEKTRFTETRTELDAAFPTTDEVGPVHVRIEKATGRFIAARLEVQTNDSKFLFEARSEKGAYQRLLSEVNRAGSRYPNDFAADYPKSSWLGFILNDLLESGLLETSLASNILANAVSPEAATATAQTCGQIRVTLGRLKTALGKSDLASCLRPFENQINRFFQTGEKSTRSAGLEFFVPLESQAGQNSVAMLMSLVAASLIDRSDVLWQRDTWPWTLAREAGFTVARQNPYTGGELQKLYNSDQTGPLGCWAAAALLARMNGPLAERFARRSLERLTLEQTQADLGALFAPESAVGGLAAEALREAGQLADADLASVAVLLGTNAARILQGVALAGRTRTNEPPAALLHPVLVASWDSLVRPAMALQVNELLNKVGTPTNPEAAFQRALFILQEARAPEEFAEAAKSLEFAAEHGLGRAQLRLGWLYQHGQGVLQNNGEALRWYVKAVDQGEPHAACRVGDMYFGGQGVDADRAKAVTFYEKDARRGCGHAQFQLGQCAEQQSELVQAFTWYRTAATNGYAQAQVILGERLGDELASKPDYLEAYLWYRVAADTGNRVAAVSARRLKSKLTPEQLERAEKEAHRLVKRIKARPPE
jgi:hypothetical protein